MYHNRNQERLSNLEQGRKQLLENIKQLEIDNDDLKIKNKLLNDELNKSKKAVENLEISLLNTRLKDSFKAAMQICYVMFLRYFVKIVYP